MHVRPATCITEREIDLPIIDVILIEGVVKGYHECGFTVMTGESFILEKKIGSRGETFQVVSSKGQLGHIRTELVTLLWLLEMTIEW